MQSFGCPEWVARKRSGVITVDHAVLAPFGRNLSEILRSTSSAGSSPETLVLASNPDTLVADGGPTAVSPTRIIDLLRRDELSLERLSHVVAFIPAGERTQFAADLGFVLTKSAGSPQVILLTEAYDDPDGPEDVLESLPSRHWKRSDLRHQLDEHEGSITMTGSQRNEYIENPDELKARLKELVRTIHEEEDPHEMTAYKKFVKRNVSVFSRAYLTAFLVKTLMNDGDMPTPSRARTKPDTPRRAPRRAERKAERRPSQSPSSGDDSDDAVTGNVAPEDRQTLFVSVGKNRRVYPKDFVALFAELEGVQGDDIGQIKILDNYSFVEVDKSVADIIIEQYNGYDFRGRKLTVNFARNKKE